MYASSIAAYDAIEGGGGAAEMAGMPGTLYGVYKRANEGTAHVYWADHRVPSVGLRPHTVFGPGRDQGLTSSPTTAMLAAAAGRSYRIPFGGRSQFQYAPDVARAFVAAARVEAAGATVHNLAGSSLEMREVVAAIEAAAPESAGRIVFDDVLLPFPAEVDATLLRASRRLDRRDALPGCRRRRRRPLPRPGQTAALSTSIGRSDRVCAHSEGGDRGFTG